MSPTASRRTARRRRSAVLVSAAIASLTTPAAFAQTIAWNNAAGGNFSLATNWNPQQIPGSANTANFALANTYTTTFTGNVTNAALTISAGNITFASSGVQRLYTLTGATTAAASMLTLNNTALTTSSFNLNGNVTASVTAASVLSAGSLNIGINGAAGSADEVIVDGNNSTMSVSSTTILGTNGTSGMILVQNNAQATFTGSLLMNTSNIANSSGNLLIQSGGNVTANFASIGTSGTVAQTAMVTVTGTGSALTFSTASANNINLGAASTSTTLVTVANGGTFSTSTGTMTVNKTATVNISGGIFNLNGGLNINGGAFNFLNTPTFNLATNQSINVSNGGTFSTPSGMGVTLAAGDVLAVTGTGSHATLGGPLTLTAVGAFLNVGQGSPGGSASVSTLSINSAAAVVDGSGSALTVTAPGTPSNVTGTTAQSAVFTVSNKASASFASDLSVTSASLSVVAGANLSVGHNLSIGPTTATAISSLLIFGTASSINLGSAGALTIGPVTGNADPNSSAFVNILSSASLTTGTGGLRVGSRSTFVLSSASSATINGPLNVSAGAVAINSSSALNANGDITLDSTSFLTRNGGTLALAPGSAFTIGANSSAQFLDSATLTLPASSTLTLTQPTSVFNLSTGFLNVGPSSIVSVIGGTATVSTLNVSTPGGSAPIIDVFGPTARFNSIGTNNTNFLGVFGAGIDFHVDNGATAFFTASAVLGSSGNSTATATVTANSALGAFASFTLGDGNHDGVVATLTASGASATISGPFATSALNLFGDSGTHNVNVNILDGAALSFFSGSTFMQSGATITVNGGFADLGNFSNSGGVINLLAGSLAFSGTLAVDSNNPFGANMTLGPAQFLTVRGPTSVTAFRSLTLNGGSLTTDSVSLATGAALTLNSGTLHLTGPQGLTFAPGNAPFPGNTTLSSTANLVVDAATTISTNSTLTLDGGSLTTGVFSLAGQLILSDGGTVQVTSNTGNNAVTSANSLILLGRGSLTSASNFTNNGEIRFTDPAAFLTAPTLTNNRILSGTGTINATLNNQPSGEVRSATGDHLVFSALTAHNNTGRFNLTGGTLEFYSTVTNSPGGQINGRGTLIAPNLVNQGQITFSAGLTDVFAPVFNQSAAAITITGGGTTTFWNGVTLNPGSSLVVSTNSTAAFESPVSGAGAISGPGTKIFDAGISSLQAITTITGSTIVNPTASVSTNQLNEQSLTVYGSVQLTAPAPGATASRLASLTIQPGGTLDLTSNSLVLDYNPTDPSPLQQIRSLLATAAGPNNLFTATTGLTSSTAHLVATHQFPSPATAIGYSESSLFIQRSGQSTFNNLPIDPSAILLTYTFKGDANLDGKVDDADVDILIAHYKQNGPNNLWTDGDFTYDGLVDNRDLDYLADTYGLIDPHFQITAAGFAKLQSLAPVPEPSTALTASFLACLIAVRPRPRRQV